MIFNWNNHSCIFIHIPKTGGNTIQKSFIDLNCTKDSIILKNAQDGFHRFEIQGEYTQKKHQTYRKYIELNSNLEDLNLYTSVRKPYERLVSFYFAAFRWLKRDRTTDKIIFTKKVRFIEEEFIDMVQRLPTCCFYLSAEGSSTIPKKLQVMRTESLELDFRKYFPTLSLASMRNKTLFPKIKKNVLESRSLRSLVENSKHKIDLDTFYS